MRNSPSEFYAISHLALVSCPVISENDNMIIFSEARITHRVSKRDARNVRVTAAFFQKLPAWHERTEFMV